MFKLVFDCVKKNFGFVINFYKRRKYLYYTRDITSPKRVTNDGVQLCGLTTPGRHSSEEMSQRWRGTGDDVSSLTWPETKCQIYRADSNALSHFANRTVFTSVCGHLKLTLCNFLMLPVSLDLNV